MRYRFRLLLIALALGWGLYEAGYYTRSRVMWSGPPQVKLRCFPHPWEARMFWPAAKVEGLVIGKQVESLCRPE